MSNFEEPTEHTDDTLVPAQPKPSRPAWIIPAAFGALLALCIVLVLALLMRDDGDEAVTIDASAPTTVPPEAGTPTTTATGSATTIAGSTTPTTVAPPVDANCTSFTDRADLPLALCDSGGFVATAQNALLNWGAAIDADGYFGPATAQAVADFQTASGLTADSVIGESTWEQLCPYSTTALCEPDGDPAGAVPAGITINGQQQSVLYECVHYPYQNTDGTFDAHVRVDQYLVDDPATGDRRVVEIWLEDDFRSLVVSRLSEASFGETEIPFGPIAASVTLTGQDLLVTADVASPTNPCDPMLLQRSDGQNIAYGVNDVCEGSARVLTFNTARRDDDTRGYSELIYSVDAATGGVVDAQLRLAGDYVQLNSIERELVARGEVFTGEFEANGQVSTFSLFVSYYPEGGHACVVGQVTD